MAPKMTQKHEPPKCQACKPEYRYIGSWGDKDSDTAIVGVQPGDSHPDESDSAFGLDLDWTAWSGEILEAVFEELNADMSDYYWTNAVKCVECGNKEACASNLAIELSSFSKVILLGNETPKIAPEFHGTTVKKIWHPAYISRNREKLDRYVRMWADALAAQSPTTLTDFTA